MFFSASSDLVGVGVAVAVVGTTGRECGIEFALIASALSTDLFPPPLLHKFKIGRLPLHASIPVASSLLALTERFDSTLCNSMCGGELVAVGVFGVEIEGWDRGEIRWGGV